MVRASRVTVSTREIVARPSAEGRRDSNFMLAPGKEGKKGVLCRYKAKREGKPRTIVPIDKEKKIIIDIDKKVEQY